MRGWKFSKTFSSVKSVLASFRFSQVLAAPAKGLALGVFDAARIDVALLEDVFVLGGEVFSDHGDHAHLGEVAGGQREIGRRAAQNVFHPPGGRCDGVKRNRTDSNDAHVQFCFPGIFRE